MADEKRGSQSDDVTSTPTFAVGFNRPKSSGTSYMSGGGGEVYFNPANLWKYVLRYFREEASRQDVSAVTTLGPGHHSRPPQWMEDKNVSIDGTLLTEEERRTSNFWQAKY
ncbi:hypothetical protein TraAM80_09030 [Trypanosoma rangeli]|uniref:Uncharacterized protein n=1 Tax=Trypanosoma rangeli TaxID=5698 RepID=A0A3R7N7Q2_TRYRA|nr:uncharacterized protein TraAM80_09030 [Trypanosoma rangeli]RNE98006.1 hypothetical protein TraAM80_09030 [Trypanosoma rangeli]|eukprot:RNE98006.1 hypothetical protein TraAM80_09030 [Trypanosoma rangeli]